MSKTPISPMPKTSTSPFASSPSKSQPVVSSGTTMPDDLPTIQRFAEVLTPPTRHGSITLTDGEGSIFLTTAVKASVIIVPPNTDATTTQLQLLAAPPGRPLLHRVSPHSSKSLSPRPTPVPSSSQKIPPPPLPRATRTHAPLIPTLTLQIRPMSENPAIPNITILGSHSLKTHDLMAHQPDTQHPQLLSQHHLQPIIQALNPIPIAPPLSPFSKFFPTSNPTRTPPSCSTRADLSALLVASTHSLQPTPFFPCRNRRQRTHARTSRHTQFNRRQRTQSRAQHTNSSQSLQEDPVQN
jgi:hypothetical protein